MPKKPPRPARPRPGRSRNEFGDSPDTLYAGGTPLFDERGRSTPKPAPKKRTPKK